MRVAASRRGGALAQFCPWGWRWFSSLAPPRPLKREPSRIGGRCGGGSEHPSRHPAVARAPTPLTPKPETRNLKPNLFLVIRQLMIIFESLLSLPLLLIILESLLPLYHLIASLSKIHLRFALALERFLHLNPDP